MNILNDLIAINHKLAEIIDAIVAGGYDMDYDNHQSPEAEAFFKEVDIVAHAPNKFTFSTSTKYAVNNPNKCDVKIKFPRDEESTFIFGSYFNPDEEDASPYSFHIPVKFFDMTSEEITNYCREKMDRIIQLYNEHKEQENEKRSIRIRESEIKTLKELMKKYPEYVN